MQRELLLCTLVFPIYMEGCCISTGSKNIQGVPPDKINQRYRAVEGEIFMMPCIKSSNQHVRTVWSKTGDDKKGNKGLTFDCKVKFLARVNHSGKYTSPSAEWFVILQIVKKMSVKCFQTNESSVMLYEHTGGTIPCPGLRCIEWTNIVWYKGAPEGARAVSEQKRASCQEKGQLHLCEVYDKDQGVYFCDSQVMEQEVMWIYRRAVSVTVISNLEPTNLPVILYPLANMTEEVEIGQSHALTCEVQFDFEKHFSQKVQWFLNYHGDMDNNTVMHMEEPEITQDVLEVLKVVRRAVIQETTSLQLHHTYTCLAINSVGNKSVTIRLKSKIKVKWPSLLGYPFGAFLLVAGLAIALRLKWLELKLIYRSNFPCGDVGDQKEFDVLLSSVWSPPIEEMSQNTSLLCGPGCYCGETNCLLNIDRKTAKKGELSPEPLEVLLPHVLEDHWGYHLCLLERDILPGGAFTNEVALGIQKSRMLICVLSAEYLSDSSAVFVLETGIQALLQHYSPKLLLIRTSSTSLTHQEPPLPQLVQKALKVLPSLEWSPDTCSKTAAVHFWNSLRKAMPKHKNRSDEM